MDRSKIDPNVVSVAGSLLAAVGAWLWAKIRGEKQEDITDALWHAL